MAAGGEEIVFRLCLLSAVAGVLGRLRRARGGAPGRVAIRAANALSAFAFAAAHLPGWHGVGPLSVDWAVPVLLLNGAGGLVFGSLFVRRGGARRGDGGAAGGVR